MGFDILNKRIALPNFLTCLVMIFTMASFSAAASVVCGTAITSDTQLDSDMSCNGTAIIINASNIVLDCAGHTIKYAMTAQGFGVTMSSVSGATVKNCNLIQENGAMANSAAVRLLSSSNNLITDNVITLAPPTAYGVALTASSNSNSINNNVITTSGSNAIGIIVYLSSKNTLTNNHVSTAGSIAHGLNFMSGSDNAVNGNTIETSGDGAAGVSITLNSNRNSFTNNAIASKYGGVLIKSSLSNVVSNNLVNATTPVVLTTVQGPNIFNNAKQPGSNIVGGQSLGGNFWANPSGTGFSQTCTDADNDGICDSALAFDSNNTDFLPLGIPVVDSDGDGVLNDVDNCPTVANADQADTDGDGIGDVCDTDNDNDGVLNVNDNCPVVANADQADLDNDGIGDACDSDTDGDGVLNTVDNCALISNPDQSDLDSDGIGNVCDSDVDGDSVLNTVDNCLLVSNVNQSDLDKDGIGDACDLDIDGDSVLNDVDACPSVSGKPEYQGCPTPAVSPVDPNCTGKDKHDDCKDNSKCDKDNKNCKCDKDKHDDCKDNSKCDKEEKVPHDNRDGDKKGDDKGDKKTLVGPSGDKGDGKGGDKGNSKVDKKTGNR